MKKFICNNSANMCVRMGYVVNFNYPRSFECRSTYYADNSGYLLKLTVSPYPTQLNFLE